MASTGLLGINPYRGGNVAIDFTSKPTQLAIGLMQKQQAQAEATEKYFKDYEKSLNPAGLGTDEVNIFAKKLKEFQENGIKNKNAINNPSKYGYDAQSAQMARAKDLQTFIEQAKQASAERKALVNFATQNKKSGKHLSDNYLTVYENAMKPVGEGYVAPDYSQIDVYDPHDDLTFSDKTWKGLPLPVITDTIYEVVNGKKTGRVKPFETESINSDVANAYAKRARSYYNSNLGTQEQYNKLAQDSDFINQMNPIYKKYFNVDIKTPADLVVAYGLATKVPKTKQGDKFDFPREYYFEEGQKRADIRSALNRAATNTGSTTETANLFDVIPDVSTVGGAYIKNGQAFDKDGNPYNGKIVIQKQNLPSEIFSVLGPVAKDVRNFDVTFENGTPVKFVNPRTGVIDRRGMSNYQLKYNTEPRKGEQPNFGDRPVPSPKTKTGAKGNSGIKWKK